MSKQSGIGVPFLVLHTDYTHKLLSMEFKCRKKLLRLKVLANSNVPKNNLFAI